MHQAAGRIKISRVVLALAMICVAQFYEDREGDALAIDDIVTGMRRAIDELPGAEGKVILTAIRLKWSDIADRLEAPSSRSH